MTERTSGTPTRPSCHGADTTTSFSGRLSNRYRGTTGRRWTGMSLTCRRYTLTQGTWT
ncbi:MAG: hypothetical protein J5658_03795 [Prevotella sp.]|nr:hypothetical protein [Prevotella sp.]